MRISDWSSDVCSSDLPCIGPERADLVIAGCAILSALCRLWPAERLRVADRGLREGMLYAMIHGVSAPHGRWAPEAKAVTKAAAQADPDELAAGQGRAVWQNAWKGVVEGTRVAVSGKQVGRT